ncbi:diguanylate cyclase [Luteibacter sp. NPDC031894]|uniref:GGDEF domain-containing protein n=1 Tax=Luteibacter sp. NPDC031894 TaxID=3390572 RepID=UPI003CFFB101
MKKALPHAFSLLVTVLLVVGTTARATPNEAGNPSSNEAILVRADDIKIADFETFGRLIDNLATRDAKLAPAEHWKLRFLQGWRSTWIGDYEAGRKALEDVADNAPDNLLRFRATATLINLLGVGHRYQDAFIRLNQLQEMMPSIRDRRARFQGLGEASQLLSSAGQFEQAEAYAREMMENPPPGQTMCVGAQHVLRAQREANQLRTLDPMYLRAVEMCDATGNDVFADTMRADIAAFHLSQGRPAEAVKVLTESREGLRALNYAVLMTEYDATLAQAYLKLGDLANARRYGLSAVAGSIKGEFTDPRRTGYGVLYEVERRLGNVQAALAYHEKYMEADKAYLNDLSARSLAFQIVDQQLLARKAEVDALNKQNEILRLTGALDRKEVETGRLYIVVLLASLGAIGWLLLWLRRSQLRFMKLARRDGLTGICNREHFVEQAQRVLAYGARSDRGACLILFDLDHFKNVNDTHGHAVGDEVLKRAVDVCRRALHACDVFGRLGGEEFAVLLPDCSPAQARARAEQLRLSIAATSATQARPTLAVTASFGIAGTTQCGFELHRLLVVADAALYRAKRAGRNCVFMGDTGDIPDSPYLSEARG